MAVLVVCCELCSAGLTLLQGAEVGGFYDAQVDRPELPERRVERIYDSFVTSRRYHHIADVGVVQGHVILARREMKQGKLLKMPGARIGATMPAMAQDRRGCERGQIRS